MPDIRIAAAAVVSATVLIGTAYSVVYGTYLDTSNPLLTHLPHPLGKTHYWASKSNFLNVYFIKYAWGWTSVAFFALLAKWTAETCAWLVFTSWFFGPALIERFIVASGGDCFVSLPSGDVITVPQEYCFAKTHINPVDHADLLASSEASFSVPPEWRGKPRLRKGHDISGHIFLLAMASLFLIDQLRVSLRRHSEPWSALHTYAVWANVALVGLWLLACSTTSIYFHSPFEKITGLLLGIASFSITQIPSYLTSREKSHTQ
ncbi:inositol phospholipid synthesis and fat-storage-inducing TM-domain-containing protein [Mucidula mucida]|nr:inositol phospholipid synthesis and fat-storage-inducing TM-domain-containing protein [Mucidula mucida]